MALLHVIQFFVGAVTTTGSPGTLAYTVPAGDRIVLRDFTFRNLSSSASYSLLVYIDSTLIYSYTLATSESHEWKPWIVMSPGQKLYLRVGNSTGVDVVVSGSLYTI